MSEDSKNNDSIERIRDEYLIKVINNNNSSLNLLVNGFYCYESIFTEDYIQQVFDDPNININDIYKLIKQGEFEIKKNNDNLKLIFSPERELNIICEDISLHYFQIVEMWKAIHSGNVKFYC